MTAIDLDTVRETLRHVIDPEIGMNIVDLGLVYGIEITEAAGIHIRMTMTSAACPMADVIIDNVQRVLGTILPPDTPVDVELVWDPPWDWEMMTEYARRYFGWTPD